MYKRIKKLLYLAIIGVVPTILSACGGAPVDESMASSSTSELALGGQRSSLSLVASSKSASVAPTSSAGSESSVPKSSAQIIDAIAPSPTSLQVDQLDQSSITLRWAKAHDNVGISHYNILRNGTLVATAGGSDQILTDKNLTQLTDYKYTIIAVDLAGNSSPSSTELRVRTLPASSSSQASSLVVTAPIQVQSSSQNPVQPSSNASVASSRISSASSLPMSASTSSLSSRPSSSSPGSSSRAMSSSSRSSTAASSTSPRSVKLTWNHPTQRENGQYLELSEIGGYEIRYRKLNDTQYTYVVIKGNNTFEYTPTNAEDIEFEIAVFDTNGVYSRFVKVTQ